jgi:hypothetical protein
MCRYGALGGAYLVTFGTRVLCAEVEHRSAVMARTDAPLVWPFNSAYRRFGARLPRLVNILAAVLLPRR